MHTVTTLSGRLLIVLIGVLALLPVQIFGASDKPQPVANESLIPKRGTNSCLIDPRFRINLDGILGSVVDLTADQSPEPAKAKDSNVEPLVSFKKATAHVTKTANEEMLYHSLLSREQTVTASFLEKFSVGMGKKDLIEVTTSERPSASISYGDIDIARIVEMFKKLPAERQQKLGVIIGLTPYVIGTSVYTEKPTSIGGNYFGVKIGKSWLYKNAENRNDYYLIAVYAPVSLLLTLVESKIAPSSIDLHMLLDKDDGGFKAMGVDDLTNRYNPVPRGLWGGE